MPDSPSSKKQDSATVLFLDVRNFTLLLDNYGEDHISELLDALFTHVREMISEHDGVVDKVIGDGIMAIFRGEKTAKRALAAATEIHKTTSQQIDNSSKVRSINIGIGIATGQVIQTNLASIDSTVIGRCVNVAARLEGLCKEYDASILIDENTYQNSSVHDLPNGYMTRTIPSQNLRGIRRTFNIYHLCDTSKYSEEYITLFNNGVEEFVSENYDRALNAFTEAYTCDERYIDQALLNHFTNSCLDRINNDRALFRNPERYEEHSNIQEKQSITLISFLQRVMVDRNFTPKRILDVGCGPGKVTEQLATRFNDATIVGIDPSRSAVANARTNHSPDHLDIEFRYGRIEDYCPENEHNSYDLIFSNSAMHWVEDQDQAYENLRQLVAEEGLLAVHQGHKGTYKQLHQIAVEVLNDFDYTIYFDKLNPPLDLIYHTAEEMKELLSRHGFQPIEFKTDEGSAPDSIIDDFAEASLNAYCDRLESESQRDVFREQFKQRSQKQMDTSDVTVRRIYFVAEAMSDKQW